MVFLQTKMLYVMEEVVGLIGTGFLLSLRKYKGEELESVKLLPEESGVVFQC